MSTVSFFDCNCMVGRRSVPRPENDLSDEQILDALARAGIERALIAHSYGKEYDPRTGNDRLVEVCRSHPHLTPCFAVLPEGCGDFPGGDELLEYLQQGGAGAVILYPNSHAFPLGETWCGNLFATLAEAGVPVLLDASEAAWPEIDRVLAANPHLNLIVLRMGYRVNRSVFPMFARYPGLRLETSYYQSHDGIEEVCRRFGADRLVFGTGLPLFDPGAAMAPVLYAGVSEEDRASIGGGTLERLLWKGAAR